MIYLISNIFSLLEKNFVKKFFLFQILIVFSSIFEILAILSVGPFVAVMFNSNLILVNEKIKFIYTYFNFNNSESFLIFLGIFTFVVMLISSILSIFINWKLTIFSQSLGYNLTLNSHLIFYKI